jgi:hypothetical protein
MKFMIRAVYNLLPTPSNLATWKFMTDSITLAATCAAKEEASGTSWVGATLA